MGEDIKGNTGEGKEPTLLKGKSVSRRDFLKVAGVAGAALGAAGGLGGLLAACGSGPPRPRPDPPPRPV